MKVMRKIIEIDDSLCNGCGECVPSCAEGALEIVNGKARMIAEKYCDGLGACLGECPTGALKIIERAADDFDEKAVEELLAKKKIAPPPPTVIPCGCPSSQVQSFTMAVPPDKAKKFISEPPTGPTGSELRQWPVQIRLVPPSAPFLKNADLLVAADCTAFAYADFHRELLAGKVLMVGCPKFDDRDGYVQKFTEIFTAKQIKSLTLAIMEVPCCGGLKMIIAEALQKAGAVLPVEVVVIGAKGHVVERKALTALV